MSYLACAIRQFAVVIIGKNFLFPLIRWGLLLAALAPAWLHAATISGTVQDPSGAVIAGAKIEITGEGLPQAVLLATDGQGKFTSPDLKPGTYSLRVMHDGFETLTKTVDLKDTAQLQLTLAIAEQQVSVNVTGKNLAFANSDPLYRKLRGIGLGQTYRFGTFTLTSDVATFLLKSGTLTVFEAVDGMETGALFIGDGSFHLKPVLSMDSRELERRTGAAEASEDFTEIVFRFTKDGWSQFVPGLGEKIETPAEAGLGSESLAGTDARTPGASGRFHAISVAGRKHG